MRKYLLLTLLVVFGFSPAFADNDYFESSTYHMTAGSRARASDVNTFLDAIETGLDKLPSETNLKRGLINYAEDAGAANAYVVTLTYAPTEYTDGMEVIFKASAANTGASTINVNTLGVKSIVRPDDVALAAGDIGENEIVHLRYNSSLAKFVVQVGARASVSTGTMAAQNADAVAITGGTLTSVTITNPKLNENVTLTAKATKLNNLSTSLVLISDHGNNLSTAATAIGTSTVTTVLVDSAIAVAATLDLSTYTNIYWKFIGAGQFAPAAGQTLTLPSPGHIDASATQQIFSGAGTVAFNTVGECFAKWHGATGDGSTDDTTAIQAAIVTAGRGGVLTFTPGNYVISDTLDLYQAINFGGVGTTMSRWNQEIAAVKFTWAGDATKPAIEIGGTASSVNESYRIVQGVYLHDFLLIPDSDGDGQDGIMIDGSNTRYASRGTATDIIFNKVEVRDFGRYNVHLLGNVFDVKFFSCGFHATTDDCVVLAEVASNYSVDEPGQIHAYDTYFKTSNVSSLWAINCDPDSDIHLYGGGVSGYNGAKLGNGSSVNGTHVEGYGSGTGIGIWVLSLGTQVGPGILDSFETLVRIGTTGSASSTDGYFIYCPWFANATTGVEITAGGVRTGKMIEPTFGTVGTEVTDTRGIGDFRMLNFGYNTGLDSIYLRDKYLGFGVSYNEFKLGYDSANTALKFITLNAGGSPRTRLTINEREATQDWTWAETRHVFKSIVLGNYATASRPASPSTGEMIYDTNLAKVIVYNGAAWVNVDGSAL